MTDFKPTLCLDFDGVLHSYSSGWKGAEVVTDPPVPGAVPFLIEALERFKVAIYSSRSSEPAGIAAMRAFIVRAAADHFMDTGGAEQADAYAAAQALRDAIQWPTAKPAAFVTLDDRALQFTGVWPDLEELLAFVPWNKRTPADAEAQLERLADKSKLVTGAQLGALVVDASDPEEPTTLREVLLHGFASLAGGGAVPLTDRALDAISRGLPAAAPLIAAPSEAMLEAARDWSAAKYGKPIGNDAARGCWAAMLGAYQTSCMAELEAFVAECDELPNPNTSLLSHNERELIGLLKRIADAIRPVV